MYTRDYVMRLIERFGRALIALRNRILGRAIDAADVQAELREIAQQAGLDLNIARNLDPQMLLMWLAPTGEIDPARFWLMGELLYLHGLQAHTSEEGDAGRADLQRAHAVFSRLPADWRPADDQSSAGDRCREIGELLER